MKVYDANGLIKTGQEARYANLYVADGSTAQSGISTTPVKVTGFAANGPSNDATPDHTNDQITINTGGTYKVCLQVSFSGTVSTMFTFHLRNNGVEVVQAGTTRTLGTGGDLGSCSFTQILNLSQSDVLTIYVEADGASKSITPEHMQLSTFEIVSAATGTGSDSDAIHGNVASEISAVTLKGTPVDGDLLLIEDSVDGNNKKRVTAGSLPGGTDVEVDTGGTLASADFQDGGDINFAEAAGVVTATIKIDTVTYDKMQNVVADDVFLGNIAGAGGIVDELTGTEATVLLDAFTDALQGVAPASGGGTTNFLRADGTWVDPPGGSGHPVSDATVLVEGSGDTTKTWRMEVDGNSANADGVFATSFTIDRTLTFPDSGGNVAVDDLDNAFSAAQTITLGTPSTGFTLVGSTGGQPSPRLVFDPAGGSAKVGLQASTGGNLTIRGNALSSDVFRFEPNATLAADRDFTVISGSINVLAGSIGLTAGNIGLTAGATVGGVVMDDLVEIGDSPTWTGVHQIDRAQATNALVITSPTGGQASPYLILTDNPVGTQDVKLFADTAGNFVVAENGGTSRMTLITQGGPGAANLSLADGGYISTGNNNFNGFYTDIDAIASPTAPSAGTRRLFADSGNSDHLSVRTSTGVVDLEGAAGSPPTGTGFRHVTAGTEDDPAELVTLTDSTHVAANQGTTNQFLRGDAAGQASWESVSLDTTEVDGILPGARGGTNNGFMDFTGPATSLKTFTLPNASSTILTDNDDVTVAQGGTGLSVGVDGGIPYFDTTSSMQSSALLTLNALMLGGGAAAAPSTLALGTAFQHLRMNSGAAAPEWSVDTKSKAFTIENPAAVDQKYLWQNEAAVEILGVSHASAGGTDIDYAIEYNTSIASGGTTIHSDNCATASPEYDVTPSGTTSVPTNQIIQINVGTPNGAVADLGITIHYRENA